MSEERLAGQLAIELWKLLRSYRRATEHLSPERAQRSLAQIRFVETRLERLLEDQGYTLRTFDGETFTANLPVIAINAEDAETSTEPTISETVEPAILREGKVISMAKVIL